MNSDSLATGTFASNPYIQYYLLIAVALALVVVCINLLSRAIGRAWAKYPALSARFTDAVAVRIRSQANQFYLIVVAISCFGFTVGLLAGNSRSPIADTVITTVLTVYGGLTVYWFKNSEQRDRILASLSLIAFSLWVIYGIHVGAQGRVQFEAAQRSLEVSNQQKLDSMGRVVERNMLLFKTQLDVLSDWAKRDSFYRDELFSQQATMPAAATPAITPTK